MVGRSVDVASIMFGAFNLVKVMVKVKLHHTQTNTYDQYTMPLADLLGCTVPAAVVGHGGISCG